jgi:hypothetical protein
MVSASASRDAAPGRGLFYRPISAGPAEIEVLLLPSDVRDRPCLTDTRLACVLGPFSKIWEVSLLIALVLSHNS